MPALKIHHTDTVETAWNGPQNKANLKNDGSESYYREAFAWQDPDGDPKTKAAYKFIHHEVDADGNVGAANVKGCQSGIGVLNGAMGGTTIPDADRKGVYNHMAAHLKDAEVEPAELNSAGIAVEKREFETRYLDVQVRAAEVGAEKKPVIEGTAAVYEQETVIAGFFREKIARGAFDRVLSEKPDVIGAPNHNWDVVLGRTSAGTLHLDATRSGLDYAIDVNPADQEAMNLYARVKRGDISQSSFAFTVRTEEWQYPEKNSTALPLRVVTEVEKLFDVSPVTFPAYPQTTAATRSMIGNSRQAEEDLEPESQAASGGAEDLKEKEKLQARSKARRRTLELQQLNHSKKGDLS
jgi:HK97 family phage prohead protease